MEEFLEGLKSFDPGVPDFSEFIEDSRIHFTKEQCSWGGKIAGKENYNLKKGLWAQTEEQWQNARSKGGKIIGKKLYDEGRGIFGMSEENLKSSQVNGGKVQGNINKKFKKGICGLTKKQRSKNTTKQNQQRWKCLITGHISTYNALSRYQNNRGIDKSFREMV